MYCSFSAKRLSQRKCFDFFDFISHCRRTSAKRMTASWIKKINEKMSDRPSGLRLKQLVSVLYEWPLDWFFSFKSHLNVFMRHDSSTIREQPVRCLIEIESFVLQYARTLNSQYINRKQCFVDSCLYCKLLSFSTARGLINT